jgi:hypothetical protein
MVRSPTLAFAIVTLALFPDIGYPQAPKERRQEPLELIAGEYHFHNGFGGESLM